MVSTEEEQEIIIRRTLEAADAGFTLGEARVFAHSDADIGLLRRLVAEGCPIELMRRILL